jgi:hypothetical protein
LIKNWNKDLLNHDELLLNRKRGFSEVLNAKIERNQDNECEVKNNQNIEF